MPPLAGPIRANRHGIPFESLIAPCQWPHANFTQSVFCLWWLLGLDLVATSNMDAEIFMISSRICGFVSIITNQLLL